MQYGMVAANAKWGLFLDEITIAEVLRDNNYSTHMLGEPCLSFPLLPNLHASILSGATSSLSPPLHVATNLIRESFIAL